MSLSAITLVRKSYKQLSMNCSVEVETFEPGTTFENTINEIKSNHLKIIASSAMNLSSFTSFDNNLE